MKPTHYLAGVLALAAATAAHHAVAADYTTYTGFAVDPAPVLPQAETHPSLWFHADDLPALHARRTADATAASLWQHLATSDFLARPFPDIPDAEDDKSVVHQYYGTMSQIAAYGGFLAQMAEAAAARQPVLDRAIAALERAYDGPIFDLDSKISGSPVDEIYRGVWMQNYAAAYDFVQPFLSAGQDARIRDRLIREGREVAANLHEWVDRPHNHLSKPAWGLGSLALALSGHPEARHWLAIALEAANQNTRYFFSADGIYREGSHYMVFSWINFVPFTYHYRNVSGVDQFPAWQPLMEWGIVARNGNGWLPNIEDAYIRPFPAHMVAGAYLNTPTRLHATAPLGSLLQWTSETTDFTPFSAAEERDGFNYTGASWDYPLALVDFLTYTPGIPPAAPQISPTVFLDGGQTFFRNTWSPHDPAQRYLLFQGVAEADNHQHFEHLSFILFAQNQMMASDAGYSRKSYGESIRTAWYRTAAAHNVVTLDGAAPVDPAENVTPVSRYRIDTTFFDFEEKEAPYPNGGSLRRAIAFPGESYFVVADILTSPQPADAVLHLHGGRGSMAGDDIHRGWTYGDDAYGPAAKLHAWILGADRPLADHEGELTYVKGDYGSYPYVTATASGTAQTFLQVLIPTAADSPEPAVEVLQVKDALMARIHDGDATDTVLVQHQPQPLAAGEIETDATFCWLRTRTDRTQVGVREATYLRHRGRELLQSALPITRAFDATPHLTRYESIEEAIARGDIEDVRQHLAAYPERLNQGRNPSLTPLHQAILRRKTDIALLLITAGADPDLADGSRRTPTHLAVERDAPEVIDALLAHQANPNLLDQTGWAPLHHAAANNRLDCTRALLNGGADPQVRSERGGTPLHEAAASADPELIQLLLAHGVDPTVASFTGVTALDIARQATNQPAIRILSGMDDPAP